MAVYQTKNKWNSQKIQKQFKNRHHDGLYSRWSKYSNSNHSNSLVEFANEYQKNKKTENIDEYDLNLCQPEYWQCSKCTYNNIERDLYCSICQSPFKSSKYVSNITNTTLSDYLPSKINDAIHYEDDLDESIQIAIILSLEQKTETQIKPISYTDYLPEKQYKYNNISSLTIPSKCRLNGYKSVKTKNRKYCGYKNDDESTIEIKTKKQWCINKTFVAKQRKKKRQIKKKRNKKLRENHKKCINTYPKIKGFINKSKIDCIRSDIKKSYDEGKRFDIKCILNYKILCKFIGSNIGSFAQFRIVYHGTNYINNKSIIENGLIVGGTKGVGIRHGAAYERGVYCSPHASTAKCYENGSIFICIVKNKRVNNFGTIWVVPNDKDILPLYLASFDKKEMVKPIKINGQINKVNKGNDGLSQRIIKFIPSFGLLNAKNSINRKIKRKWNAYDKINQFI